MRFLTPSAAAALFTLLSSVESGVATAGKGYPWDKTIGAPMLCNNPEGFQHGRPYVAVFIDAFTGYGLCNRWVRITDTLTGKTDYGQLVDQVYSRDINDLHLAYTFYSTFAFVGTNPSLNITWEIMPSGYHP